MLPLIWMQQTESSIILGWRLRTFQGLQENTRGGWVPSGTLKRPGGGGLPSCLPAVPVHKSGRWMWWVHGSAPPFCSGAKFEDSEKTLLEVGCFELIWELREKRILEEKQTRQITNGLLQEPKAREAIQKILEMKFQREDLSKAGRLGAKKSKLRG